MRKTWYKHMKKTLISMRAVTRRQNITLFDFHWEHVCQKLTFFTALGTCMNDQEGTTNIDFEVTNFSK